VPWRWRLSYQYATIMDRIHAGITPGVYSAFEGSTPHHEVKGGLGYSWGRLELDLLARYQSQFLDYRFVGGAYRPVPPSDYVTATAHAGYRPLEALYLGLTLEQLNQSTLYQRASVPVERRAIASATLRF